MINLEAWADAQDQHLAELREIDAEGSLLRQLLEASCMLELSKIATAQPPLALFVEAAVEVLTQFFPIDGCSLRVQPAGLPEVTASRGDATSLPHSSPIRSDGEVIGHLETSAVAAVFGDSHFFDRVADHLALGLAAVATVERLRRDAAAATASRLAAGLEDWRDEPWLEELVESIAVLPNALGAALTVEADDAPAGEVSVQAGIVGVSTADERRRVVDRVAVALTVCWAAPPERIHLDVLDDIWEQIVTAVERAEERRRTREHVQVDALTGLRDRRRAIDDLGVMLRQARRSGDPIAALVVDLDGFRDLNRDLGNVVGDRVLVAVAQTLEREAPDAVVARTGPDEFLLAIPRVGMTSVGQEAERVRKLVQEACAAVLPARRRQTASVGASVYPNGGAYADAVVREASKALLDARARGGAQVVVATPSGSDRATGL